MGKPSLNAGGVTLAIILGLLTGPMVFYAIFGDYWHSTGVHPMQWMAGAAGAVVGVGALLNAARFRNAGLAAAITGVAAGVGELTVAVVPWLGFNATHPRCDANNLCPLAPADLQQIALVAGVFAIGLFTVLFFALTTLIVAIRGRLS